jgi:NADPH2:quinone reductase
MVSFGATSGLPPAVEVGVLNAKGSLFLTRPSGRARQRRGIPEPGQDVLNAVASGILTPQIWKSYALADAALAHADLEHGRSQGAIILNP